MGASRVARGRHDLHNRRAAPARAPAQCDSHTKIVRRLRSRLRHGGSPRRSFARLASSSESGALESVGHFRRHSTRGEHLWRLLSGRASRCTIIGACGSGSAPGNSDCKSRALFLDGMGGSAVLLRSLGTRARRDRWRTRSIRPKASTLGPDRLAGGARRSPGSHRACALWLRCRSCAARLRIAPTVSWFRFHSGGA